MHIKRTVSVIFESHATPLGPVGFAQVVSSRPSAGEHKVMDGIWLASFLAEREEGKPGISEEINTK